MTWDSMWPDLAAGFNAKHARAKAVAATSERRPISTVATPHLTDRRRSAGVLEPGGDATDAQMHEAGQLGPLKVVGRQAAQSVEQAHLHL